MKLLLENWRRYIKEEVNEGFLDAFYKSSDEKNNTFEVSPEEEEYRKSLSGITGEQLKEAIRIYEKYNALIYGGDFIGSRGSSLRRSPYGRLSGRGKKKRIKEVIEFYNSDLADYADILAGVSDQIEKGNYDHPRSALIFKMNKKFKSAQKVARGFISTARVVSGGDVNFKPRPGYSDISSGMAMAKDR